jgi:23S rRNA maturation-related 3'-5' exoribonuclease YhaM
MREKIEELLMSTGREGMANLLQYMRSEGFYSSPCSGAYHLAKEGGLAEHSLNVYNTMVKLNKSLDAEISDESVIIVSLLHDLGKAGQFGKSNYVANILKSGKQSYGKPYETNKELLYVPHEIRSIQIASQFIELTELENNGILFHNGMYSELKYAYQGKETPIALLVHAADMWCSRVTEI